MLPYNAYLSFGIGLIMTLIPIAMSWPGVELPPWVGLGLGMMTAAGAYTLKSMAPASDVHKDSELPAPQQPSAEDVAREYFKLRQQEAEQRRAERRASGG